MSKNKAYMRSLSLLCAVFLFSFFSADAAPGDLDPGFGIGGKVVTPASKFSADYGHEAALQPDGKIVVAGRSYDGLGSNFVVTRINSNGTLDRTFGNGGKVVKNFFTTSYALAVAVQPDGKIIAGGFAINLNTSYRTIFTLVRFNSDGSADESFGTNGVIQTPFDTINSWATSIAVQADGKIVAAGFTYGNSSFSPFNFAVARFNADGTPDNSFDGDGKLLIDFGGIGSRANAVIIQPDNKIIVGGYHNSFIAVARLNASGTLDTTFGTGGKVTTQINNQLSSANALALQPDGKIVAAGSIYGNTNNDVALVRHNSDGSLDASFDADGMVTTDFDNRYDTAKTVAVQADGKIVIGGVSSQSQSAVSSDFLTVRYQANGSLDNSFDGDGKIVTAISASDDQANAALIQPDGKIVLVGYGVSSNYEIALVRYNNEGSLDLSFDSDGIILLELENGADIALDVAVQTDGKIVAVGYSFTGVYREFTVVRYNSDGTLDDSFGSGGTIINRVGSASSLARSVVIQPDGKILVGGSGIFNGNNDFIFVRYNQNGSLDNSFGNLGIVNVAVGTDDDFLNELALQPDGKIVAAGYGFGGANEDTMVVRLHADGLPDASFDGDGKTITPVGGSFSSGNSLAIQSDGKLVVAGMGVQSGRMGTDFSLIRYNADGSLDASFDGDGKLITSIGTEDAANSVKIQPDGKIVAAGYSDMALSLARYNSDGSLDNSFDGDGKVTTAISESSYNNQIWDIELEADGKIIAAGGIVASNGFEGVLVRYNPNGSLDGSFGGSGVVRAGRGNGDSEFAAVALQNDGNIIVAGYRYDGQNYDFTAARYKGVEAASKTSFDFDGDGKSDVSVFRPSNGVWYLQRSQAGFSAAQFGVSEDLIAPADFDGDGKTDLAVFRPSSGTWFVLNSSNNQFASVAFGQNGDVPRPGDFDGDGRADFAVFRPSNGVWYILRSQAGFTAEQFGTSGDVPLIADFDGDGKSDVSVFRPSNGVWYYLSSSNKQFNAINFGSSGDIPAAGDFDGDGKTDHAVFRPSDGVWYLLRSQTGFAAVAFGQNGDAPTVGDFDGDGKSDIAVFRPQTGVWYLLKSQSGFSAISFGINTDKPLPAAFIR